MHDLNVIGMWSNFNDPWKIQTGARETVFADCLEYRTSARIAISKVMTYVMRRTKRAKSKRRRRIVASSHPSGAQNTLIQSGQFLAHVSKSEYRAASVLRVLLAIFFSLSLAVHENLTKLFAKKGGEKRGWKKPFLIFGCLFLLLVFLYNIFSFLWDDTLSWSDGFSTCTRYWTGATFRITSNASK